MSLLELPVALLLLSSDAEAGQVAAPGTSERQNSGDCSGYARMIKEIADVSRVVSTHVDASQRVVEAKQADGDVVLVTDYNGELLANLYGSEVDIYPRYSATWSQGEPGAPNCMKEIAAFRSAAEGFLPGKDPAAARQTVEKMKQAFGRGACVNAQVFGEGSTQVDEEGGYWRYQDMSFMAGGYELSAKGVDAECVNSLMQSSQEDSPCVWGTKALATDDFPGMEGSKVLGAQCFDSVEAKRAVVSEPMSSTGFRFERKAK